MGHKNICFTCRKAFSLGTDIKNRKAGTCPECGEVTVLMTHRFRPPKKDDAKKWQTVKYLADHGFTYQHVYEDVKSNNTKEAAQIIVAYPENLREAKEFVQKYKNQALS